MKNWRTSTTVGPDLLKLLASHANSARRYADGRYPTASMEEAANKAKAHAAAAEATAAEIAAAPCRHCLHPPGDCGTMDAVVGATCEWCKASPAGGVLCPCGRTRGWGVPSNAPD